MNVLYLIILMIIIITIIFFSIQIYFYNQYQHIINKNGDYIIYKNFINLCQRNELLKSKKLLKENKLDNNVFNKSKSIVIYFKDFDFLKKICIKHDLNLLYDISTKIINKSPKKGNYFILNLLEIKPIKSNEYKKYDPDLHYDDSILYIFDKMKIDKYSDNLLTNNDYKFRPDIVSVLYINKDNCYTGGELDLFKTYTSNNDFLIGSINENENNLIYFSGAYYHGVKNYSIEKCNNINENRFSLVIEIYNIKESRLNEMLNFSDIN